MGKIDVKHLYCCLPMAIWHSFLLVGHYRIFRSMNTLTNYHSLDPRVNKELWSISQIIRLKSCSLDVLFLAISRRGYVDKDVSWG